MTLKREVIDAGIRFGLGADNCALDDNEDYLSELRPGRLLGRSVAIAPAALLRSFIAVATEWGAEAAFLDKTGSHSGGIQGQSGRA